MKTLTIIAVGEPVTKQYTSYKTGEERDFTYRQLTLAEPQYKFVKNEEGKRIKQHIATAKTRVITQWAERITDHKMDALYNAQVGELVEGALVTVETEPYIIRQDRKGVATETTATTFTALVFGNSDEESFGILVRKAVNGNKDANKENILLKGQQRNAAGKPVEPANEQVTQNAPASPTEQEDAPVAQGASVNAE